ncbi:hypothetical protein H5410_058670 [Solanum commersonii]|uniref:LOB domain-containing protein n=1 Tax=Solanum commersonii TaxID=4109 RepID=A0A9J5WU71_SOLCO|nr:hypothetical protein H5410_058670 [Solanum commersonii]
MEYSSTNYPPSPLPSPTSSAVSSSSSSPNSPPTDLRPAVTSLPSSSRYVFSPVTSSCAACKFLGRNCAKNCVLAPWFPPNDTINFSTVHRVYGASNVIKSLQELPESQRADAVSSMVYEANARLRDPVYGCAGSIFHLQKQVSDLQAQLAKAQAEIVNMQCQQAHLLELICMEMGQSPQAISPPKQSLDNFTHNIPMSFLDDDTSGSVWEALWT